MTLDFSSVAQKWSWPGLNPDNTALLVIDFNDLYVSLDEEATLEERYDLQRALISTDYLSRQLKELYPNMPQIWITDESYKGRDFEWDESEADIRDLSIRKDDVTPHFFNKNQDVYDHVIVKRWNNSFKGWECETGRTLSDILEEAGVKNVLISGMRTNTCVIQTCYGAKEAGFRPHCIPDCIFGGDLINKKYAMMDFNDSGISVLSLKTIADQLGVSLSALKEKDALLKEQEAREKSKIHRRSFLGLNWGRQPL